MKKSKVHIVLVAVLALAVTSTLGAGAYTSFNADRATTMNVVNDDSGIVALNPGSSSIVTTTGGALAIDVTNSGASGVNVESTLAIGDSTDPTNVSAFTVTNNANTQKTIDLSYAMNTDPDANNQYTFTVYDNTGTEVSTFNEGGSASLTASSGATYYVVMDIDTTGLSDTADLSGTLSVSSS